MSEVAQRLRSYVVTTAKFGEVTIQAFDIADARRDARKRFGVKNPSSVRAVATYTRCAECDSKPCCCKEGA